MAGETLPFSSFFPSPPWARKRLTVEPYLPAEVLLSLRRGVYGLL